MLHGPASKTNHKLVRIHFASFWCWDKPQATLDSLDSPRPGLEGSHHLPPYNILCVAPPRPHPSGSLSRDSQSGVSKLSRFGLPGLWAIITSRPNLRLGRGLNQTCSSPWDLSNAMSHSPNACRDRVDSRLYVVGSQTASLTTGPSFAHNLSCRCPNGSCEAILGIYTSTPFQWYQEHPNSRCFDPYNQALNFRKSWRTSSPQLWECSFILTLGQSGVATISLKLQGICTWVHACGLATFMSIDCCHITCVYAGNIHIICISLYLGAWVAYYNYCNTRTIST